MSVTEAADIELKRPADAALWERLAEVCERINGYERDLEERRDLYIKLFRDRGYSMPQIARVASRGRDEPLGYRSVSFIINKKQ